MSRREVFFSTFMCREEGLEPEPYLWQRAYGPEKRLRLAGSVPNSEHDFCGGQIWWYESCNPAEALEWFHSQALVLDERRDRIRQEIENREPAWDLD